MKRLVTSVDKEVDQLEFSCIAARSVKWKSTLEKSLAVSYKIIHTLTICLAISIIVIYLKEIKMDDHTQDLYMNCQSSFIYNSLKLEIAQVSINRQIDTLWKIPTIAWYSVIKKQIWVS